jgi:hypothetical protein
VRGTQSFSRLSFRWSLRSCLENVWLIFWSRTRTISSYSAVALKTITSVVVNFILICRMLHGCIIS